MLQGKATVKASLEVIIRDTLVYARNFHSCFFHFVFHNCNRVANTIAKYALSLDAPITWQENVPNWVSKEASVDISSMD
ncbi:hypothetical protein RHMOL_Rhmol06G0181600 [Rhododendron molle]|uniref:Uncharacterized protein n=1 Tax=Rhododendron molle TaxID=49168 RepID=A0ACC0NFJ6_RHOML|nr:hypothetical protein RHMOL_Rhmol06G0181600 [Rhododendron molle]